MSERPQKITFGELRAQGVSRVLVYCADYTCGHSVTMDAGTWPDDLRLSDIGEDFPSSKMGA